MNEKLVRTYLNLFFSNTPDFDAIRELLWDSFTFNGPLLKAGSADEYIALLKEVGAGSMSAKIDNIISSSDQVAVLYDMITPLGKVRMVEWFTVKDNKIYSIELLNDPGLFIEAFSK